MKYLYLYDDKEMSIYHKRPIKIELESLQYLSATRTKQTIDTGMGPTIKVSFM